MDRALWISTISSLTRALQSETTWFTKSARCYMLQVGTECKWSCKVKQDSCCGMLSSSRCSTSLKTPGNSLLQLSNITKTAYRKLPKNRLHWPFLTSGSPGNRRILFSCWVVAKLHPHFHDTQLCEQQHLVKHLLLSSSLDSTRQRHTHTCSDHK